MHTLFARIGRTRLTHRLAGLALLLILPASATAQGMRDLVEAALDEKITERVEIPARPIRAALAEVTTATGLEFLLDDEAVQLLPYGVQTQVTIVMEDISVRRALGRIFDGLGLTMTVEDAGVHLQPAPWLARLGRRITIDEVELLQKLAAGPWANLNPGDITIRLDLPTDGDPRAELDALLRAGGGASALDQLEIATQRMGCFWTPEAGIVVVYSRAADIDQRLGRTIDINYRRAPLDQVLLGLSRQIGVTFHFEPAALQSVQAAQRKLDLVQHGVTARQVLELIAGSTGLWYEIVEDGVVIGAAPAADQRPPGSRVVAIMRIPVGDDGTTIDFLFRADELPPEFSELRSRKLPEIIEILRLQLAD